jgi:hypothetical protein
MLSLLIAAFLAEEKGSVHVDLNGAAPRQPAPTLQPDGEFQTER